MRRNLAFLPLALLPVLFPLLSAPIRAVAPPTSSFSVIVHPSDPTTSMTRAELSRLFLKKVTRWKDGVPVVPVDLAESSPIRHAFSRAIHGRDVPAIKNYWQQQIFSGRGIPPRELGSDEEIVHFVARIPGAIGYVSKGTSLQNVRILSIGD